MLNTSLKQNGKTGTLGLVRSTRPLVSIVVVVYRDSEALKQILESVLPHKVPDVEVIVIDGDSKDGTIELLQSYGTQVDRWISEPDRGVYDAMNKGLAMASGEYVLHLNAGDTLIGIPWETLRQSAREGIDVVCGRVLIDRKTIFKSRTSFLSTIDNTWHHQGTFYRRSAHLGYNQAYPILGDFDHNLRLLKARCSMRQTDVLIAGHESGGLSMSTRGHKEHYSIVRANFGFLRVALAWIRFTLRDLRDWTRRLR